jgi:hypothetical protein
MSSNGSGADLPTAKTLERLDTALTELEADRAELADQMRQEIGRSPLVHEGALKVARKMKTMTPVERAAFWKHLQHYVGVWELDAQLEMFEEPALRPRRGRFEVVS